MAKKLTSMLPWEHLWEAVAQSVTLILSPYFLRCKEYLQDAVGSSK